MGRARDLSLLGHHRWEEPGVCLCLDIIDEVIICGLFS